MKYCPEIIAEICKHVEAGNSNVDAACLVGICEDTFYEWKKDKSKPEFSETLKKAENKCKARNIAIIQQAAITTWQAAAWFLERRYGFEYARRDKVQHSGDKDAPVFTKRLLDD